MILRRQGSSMVCPVYDLQGSRKPSSTFGWQHPVGLLLHVLYIQDVKPGVELHSSQSQSKYSGMATKNNNHHYSKMKQNISEKNNINFNLISLYITFILLPLHTFENLLQYVLDTFQQIRQSSLQLTRNKLSIEIRMYRKHKHFKQNDI